MDGGRGRQIDERHKISDAHGRRLCADRRGNVARARTQIVLVDIDHALHRVPHQCFVAYALHVTNAFVFTRIGDCLASLGAAGNLYFFANDPGFQAENFLAFDRHRNRHSWHRFDFGNQGIKAWRSGGAFATPHHGQTASRPAVHLARPDA